MVIYHFKAREIAPPRGAKQLGADGRRLAAAYAAAVSFVDAQARAALRGRSRWVDIALRGVSRLR